MKNFDEAPFLVIWEVTRACDLACVHCRASADPVRNPAELSTEEGFRLLETIKEFGDPIMIFDWAYQLQPGNPSLVVSPE